MLLNVIAGMLAVVAAWAGPDNTVLTAERDIYGFHAQQALVFENDRLTFSRNSNFLCPASDEVVLGVFHAAYTPNRKTDKAYLDQIMARLPAVPVSAVASGKSPHDLKLFIGARDITADQPNSLTVRRLLTSACDEVQPKLEEWRTEFGVVVKHERIKGDDKLRITELAGAGRGHTSVVTFKKAGCRQTDASKWDCPIAKYGMVSFVVNPH